MKNLSFEINGQILSLTQADLANEDNKQLVLTFYFDEAIII